MDEVIWPTPPEYEFPPSIDGYGPEPCILNFSDGREGCGNLLAYAEALPALRFQSDQGDPPALIALNDLREIHLQRPVAMKRQDRLFEGVGVAAEFGADEKYGYSIHLRDGALLHWRNRRFHQERCRRVPLPAGRPRYRSDSTHTCY